jgi:hypothetical protein
MRGVGFWGMGLLVAAGSSPGRTLRTWSGRVSQGGVDLGSAGAPPRR